MAWATPKTWSTGELVTASDLNTFIRDNTNALFKPNFAEVVGSGTDFSTTSTVNTDITGMSVNITTTGGNLLVVAFGEFNGGGGYSASLAISVDGADYDVGENTSGSHVSQYVCGFRVFTVAAGSHTVKLRCRTASGGTASFVGGTVRRLLVAEGVI